MNNIKNTIFYSKNQVLRKFSNLKFNSKEHFSKYLNQQIQEGLNDISNGNYMLAEDFFKEMEAKYEQHP